tara:strand:- start:625 stop:894 length:270 start_codon:yes stop_codon:yes gene_type:complete
MTNRKQKSKNEEKKMAALAKKKPKAKAKTVSKGRPPTLSKKKCAPEQRHQMIAEAAYCLAEKHGFQSERTLDDWLQAEAEVDSLISIIR